MNTQDNDPQTLMARLARLEAENSQMRQRGLELEQENHELQEQLAAAPAPSPSLLPKVTLPEKYDGNRAAFRGFVNQLHLLFLLNASRYPTDQIKIFTVGSLLTGKALAWFNPLLEQPERYTETLSSFDQFLAAFRATFGPVEPRVIAANKIRRLCQGAGPASSYAAEFNQLAADLNWNDDALIDQFRAGLNSEVKNMLTHFEYPQTLQEAISVAVRCDQRLYENRLEQQQRQRNTYPRSIAPSKRDTIVMPSNAAPIPMEVDQIRRGPLSAEERQRRLRNNLCLVCGASGHYRETCPIARRRVAKISFDNAQNQGNDAGQ